MAPAVNVAPSGRAMFKHVRVPSLYVTNVQMVTFTGTENTYVLSNWEKYYLFSVKISAVVSFFAEC